MSSVDEIVSAINAKGEEIRLLKASNSPTVKADLEPLIASLLALKTSYKDLTGESYDKPKEEKIKKEENTESIKKEGPSKSELNKLKRKEARVAAISAKKGDITEESISESTKSIDKTTIDQDSEISEFFGDYPLIQSTVITDKNYRRIEELTEDKAGLTIWIRGRVAVSRSVGKGVFIVLRQGFNTVQAVIYPGGNTTRAFVKYSASVSLESIVDLKAEITIPNSPILSTTLKNIELSVSEIHVVSRAVDVPFSVEDAGRNIVEAAEKSLPTVLQDTLLNYRWIDTRTPANQAIFRIQSGVCQLFREFFIQKNFIEIHTPKLIGGASEGGSNVFTLKYFDQPACLAQSPQLYKQMAAACGGFERIFEIGPVFRAENSNTHRHLCEFTGLDFEMAIYEHYYEALQVMSDLFIFIFDGISEKYKNELEIISQQYPFEPIKYLRPSLRLTFQEGITLLREAGIAAEYDEDLSTPQEKALGAIVKEKYQTDFYIMDKYPLNVRPFYTMPDPNNSAVSNSYDLFIRGEEIVSGAQRIHDVNLLIERANHWKIPIDSVQSYIDAFKHGALPHAGGGIGLERVVMLYLGLKNIRQTSMFPRDPKRLSP
mmetsp:Transcript_8177/g.7324  ORF Transcript_8177/g.7324 Transcript_8177/m.7324 type:complete len:602 (+) Transcript_8177:35-1840(+)|eukprot:CAMPEP_0196761196 /NCGR_PEP_ID=MMETSP1095-20130614/364_1 /TAXON_ID=96789 ORGANISM="Chromulina nebulosa, Strain UTEXLB2642" /NCGR_SAMPLE_ID=MMETSP1095 /ASSEMBLY_ACC=CAM_ASM_000446 /LENGTH=601 /DNA_ID=CAMNT_0042110429 /DNA_START=28 /DNA_END=1833 /DNA_ORIENTATION=+